MLALSMTEITPEHSSAGGPPAAPRLAAGTRIGAYEVVAAIGSGGMGEVYRARDPRLHRDVAIKVLSPDVTADPDRMARFRREAKMLAALSHPNIAAIHDLAETDRLTAIVMELVDGPSLAERLRRGPLPAAEAIAIARQIAEALDAAHERGIIHRDLKPANVILAPGGVVKLVDFGLAKTVDAPGAGDLTVTALETVHGAVLGTVPYMSPEQARGDPVDKRTDIWAFGCVFYELLTGEQPFVGRTTAETVGRILEREPDWTRLPASSSSMRSLIQHCLEKNLRRRLRDLGDADFAIGASAPATAAPRRVWQIVGAAAILGLLGGGVAGTVIERARARPAAEPVQRFEWVPRDNPISTDAYVGLIAISPDARRVVYTAAHGGSFALAIRNLDQLDSRIIAGSDGGFQPFFSPDGRQIGFGTFTALRRVDVSGGPTSDICPVDAYFSGAAWGPDDTIFFTQGALGLFRVPASGGQPERIATPDERANERAFTRPVVLPGGQAILYTVVLRGGGSRIAARRLNGSSEVTIIPDGIAPLYMPSGFLMYLQANRLRAIRFDPGTLQTSGAPVALEADVYTSHSADAMSNVAVAADGTSAYLAGHTTADYRRVAWFNSTTGERLGAAIGQPLEQPRFLRISPDGRHLAVCIGPGGFGQIWIYDLAGGAQPVKLTFADHNLFPVWSPDGRRIVFFRRSPSGNHLFVLPSDGSATEPELLTNEFAFPVAAWSPDGAVIIQEVSSPAKIWLLRVSDRKATQWLQTPFNEAGASLSFDGRWLAYSSNQTGADEVWVRPFPGPGAPVRVSSDGGRKPLWSRDGKTLYYEVGPNLMAARVVSTTPAFAVSQPRLLVKGGFFRDETDPHIRYVDAAPDGRLLAVETSDVPATPSIVVVRHWDTELRRLLP
jgi:eukaryotic-like serine/threonine-protein kinase